MRSAREVNADLCHRFARWMIGQKYAPSTRLRYVGAVREYSDFFDDRVLTKTTHFDVQEFLAARAKQRLSARTLRGLINSLRIFSDFLNLGGPMMWVPPRLIRPRRALPVVPRVLSTQQIDKLFSCIRTKFERAVLETLYGTGCRTGELRSMRVEDVDFVRKRIVVRGKRGERYVAFTTRVLNSLREYLEGRTTGYLFVDNHPFQRVLPRQTRSGAWHFHWRVYNEKGELVARRDGFVKVDKHSDYAQAVGHFSKLASKEQFRRPVGLRPITSGIIDGAVREVGLRAGVKVFPYCLRHSFATHLLDNGADIRAVQYLMGHANLQCTHIYAHVSKPLVERALREYCPRQ